MFDVPRDGLPRAVQAERDPLGPRSPGEAWRNAETGLEVPKPDSPVAPVPARRSPESVRRTLASYRRSPGARGARSAEEA